MAAQYCRACGTPLPADAEFCTSCGKPTRDAPGPAPPLGGPLPPPPPPPVAGPPLGAVLGVAGKRSFLLQHQLGTGGRNYRVLDAEKHHLFTAHEDVSQELRTNFLGGMGQQASGFRLGPALVGTTTYLWRVLDAQGTPRASISIQMQLGSAVSTLADAQGAPILAVNVQRRALGGMTATAAFPDGRAMFEAKGNLIHHNFSIHDPAGTEVAKIHEAFASVRDTYNLDLVGPVDPLCVLIFAILIDREKEPR